jgi:hypothetical protein
VVPEGPEAGLKSLHFTCEHLDGWAGYISRSLQSLYGKGDDLLCFQARGGPRTPQVAVELRETDGSRWIATTAIGVQWRRVALPLTAFRYWQDSPTGKKRGGAKDRLRPGQVCRIQFGLSSTHTPAVGGGRREFWISGLGTARDPATDIIRGHEMPPTFEPLSPAYKVY